MGSEKTVAFLIGLCLGAVGMAGLAFLLPSQQPARPVSLAELPKNGAEEWMVAQVMKVQPPFVDVIGCPARNPIYGPVTFQIGSEEFAEAMIPGVFVPILYERQGKDQYEYKGYATLGVVSDASSVPADDGAGPDASGG